MNEDLYAIKTDFVNEVLSDSVVYPIPFTPNYVCGLVNRRGTPFTVVDPMVFFNKNEQNSKTLILLKNLFQDEKESFSVKITDVLDFFDVDSDTEKKSSETFLWKKKKVKILDALVIYNKLKQDFKNIYGGKK